MSSLNIQELSTLSRNYLIYKYTFAMKNLIGLFSAILLIIFISSCASESASLDPAQREAKIDSLVTLQQRLLEDSVNQVCTQKMGADYATQVDSMVQVLKSK